MLKAVVSVLSIRATLLLALIGAFVLALRALNDQTYMSLGVLGIYCLCTIFPVVFLEIQRRMA